MKPYSFNEFNKRFNMFGWLHPDIRQTYWTKEETAWDYETQGQVRRTYTLSTLWYNDQRILQFYTNDETNKGRRLTSYNVHREAAKDTGLVNQQSYRINASTLIDALYYRVNAPNYYNKDGTLKKGVWSA